MKKALETELRSESDSQVIVSAIPEVDVIANFGTQANRPTKNLDASPRIYGKPRGAGVETYHTLETGSRVVVGNAEIIESNFSRDKNTDRASSSLKFRAKKSV